MNSGTDSGSTVAVIGAGITGLALTHYLTDRDVDVVTLEASSQPGGVIRSVNYGGTVLELGPQRFRLTDGVSELAEAAGIRDAAVTAPDGLPLYIYASGGLREVPLSIRGLIRTDLLSWRGKLRLLAEPLTDPIHGEETAAAAFRRKFGAEVYRNLIHPLYGGTYGSDPAEMPAEHALDGLMRVESREGSLLRPALRRVRNGGSAPAVTFERGNQQLATELARTYQDRVRLDTRVESLRDSGGSYRLGTSDGSLEVSEVVLTAPASMTAQLLEEVAPGAATGLSELRYNSLAYVFLQSAADVSGLGYQVRRSEPLRTLGVTWNASAFDRDGLFTAFLGGMEDPGILEKPESEIGRIAAQEFETVMDVPAEPLFVNVVTDAIPAYDGSWEAIEGLDAHLPEGIRLATNYTARVGVPGRVREAKRVAQEIAQTDEVSEGMDQSSGPQNRTVEA